jgi:hypothetical protein
MITWRLWSALHNPPTAHPIFQRVRAMRAAVGRWRWLLASAAGVLLTYTCYQLSFMRPPVRLILLSLTLQDIVVIFVGFNLVYGCILVLTISQTIVRAREGGLYEMLSLTPVGKSGTAWAMCAGAVYRGRGFDWFRLTVLLLTVIPLFALIIELFMLVMLYSNPGINSLNSTAPDMHYKMLLDVVYGLGLVVAFYTACVQSVILALLVGMLAPAAHQSGASLWAVGCFLLLQVLSYIVALVFSLLFLPALYQLLGLAGWWADVSVPVWRLGCFFLVREAINNRLWRALIRWWDDANSRPMPLLSL